MYDKHYIPMISNLKLLIQYFTTLLLMLLALKHQNYISIFYNFINDQNFNKPAMNLVRGACTDTSLFETS